MKKTDDQTKIPSIIQNLIYQTNYQKGDRQPKII